MKLNTSRYDKIIITKTSDGKRWKYVMRSRNDHPLHQSSRTFSSMGQAKRSALAYARRHHEPTGYVLITPGKEGEKDRCMTIVHTE